MAFCFESRVAASKWCFREKTFESLLLVKKANPARWLKP